MSEQLLKFFSDFLAIVLPALATLLGAVAIYVIQWLKAKIDKEFSELEINTQELIRGILVNAVSFAEQTGLAAKAEEKKNLALAYAEAELKKLGIEYDLFQLADQIEAILFQEINQEKLLFMQEFVE